jgi:hypothetical protein
MVNLHNWFDVSEIELRIKKKNAEKLGNFASHGTSRLRSRGKSTASRIFSSLSMVMTSRESPSPQPA